MSTDNNRFDCGVGYDYDFSMGFSNEYRLEHRIDKGRSLVCLPQDYTIIDLETTGLSPRCDEIIELAAIRVRDGEVTDSYQRLVKPKERISDFISSITHITNEMVAEAPPIEDVLSGYIDFIGSDVVVGHNVSFDVNFLFDNCVSIFGNVFTNDYINSIKNNNQEQFRREYRDLDALLVDDVHFFSNKEGTRLEFFNTFNSLHDNNKQIVLTADRNPKQIPDLTDRLVSRFVWGVPVEITSPDLETRTAILRSKAEEEQINVPNDVLSFIAKVDTNVRELESALLRVRVAAQLHHAPITIELANETLKGMEAADEAVISIDLIQKKVAAYYNIRQSDIVGKKRVKQIVFPRQIAMYLARELTESSLPKIGKEFGGKDHTTVLHAIDKIEKQLAEDDNLQDDIRNLRMELQP